MPNPSPEQRAEFEGSFSYNIGVLLSMSRLYLETGSAMAATLQTGGSEYAAADALFEMILLRLRAIDSFLAGIGTKSTDAHASDWAPNWQPKSVLLGTERNDISKRLAHLTYVQPPDHEWAIGQMVHRGVDGVTEFLDQVSAPVSQTWMIRRKEAQDYVLQHSTHAWDEIWTANDNHAHRRT